MGKKQVNGSTNGAATFESKADDASKKNGDTPQTQGKENGLNGHQATEREGRSPPRRSGSDKLQERGESPSSPTGSWKLPSMPSIQSLQEVQLPPMFAHMLERQSVVDLRRRAVTLIDVVAERQKNGPFKSHRLLAAFACSVVYRFLIFPWCRDWGLDSVPEAAYERAGGPWSAVSWQWAALVTFVYGIGVLVGVLVMAGREPVSHNIFEYMFVYNLTHVFVNVSLGFSLLQEAWNLGFHHPWGNSLDPSPVGYKLGMLLWCQYHYKQFELLDTVFVILRNKFERMGFLHLYLHVAQMWGWYFACRFGCGGDAYFPAVVNAFCQVIVYLFYAISMVNEKGIPLVRKAHVTEVQVAQFAICATHAFYCLAFGHFPRLVAIVSLGVAFSGVLLYVEWRKGSQPLIHPRTDLELSMFGHMFQKETLTDLRRRSMTLIDVVTERKGNGPLMPHRILGALIVALLYWFYVLPACRDWGLGRWYQSHFGQENPRARAGGPWAEVHFSFGFFVSLLYFGVLIFGTRIMERRRPVQKRVFEYMFIHNAVQVIFNALLSFNLWREAWRLGFAAPWGNQLDYTPAGHRLGMLLWFQYHSSQLELLDTIFVVARKKFNRMSGLHIILHLVQMWGWFFVCRYAGGGDSYFPAAVKSTCQVCVYFYYAVSLIDDRGVFLIRKARIAEVQVLQFLICASHACYVLYAGNLPRGVAMLNLMVMGVSLGLYTDFAGDSPRLGVRSQAEIEETGGRLTFRFDSSAWFYIYHFGVAQFLKEHILPDDFTADKAEKDFPKGLAFAGSSGGALVAGALATGIDTRQLFEFVLQQHEDCRLAPWRLFPAVEKAMHKYLPENAAKSMSGRVRVLLTKISWKPPFITGEAVDQYSSWPDAFGGLRATCHVPGLNPMPYKYLGRYYFDGLVWSSLLVPWSGDIGDLVVKVSAVGAPLTDIRAPISPLWWAIFPPSIDILRGMFWVGYRDAAQWFAGPADGNFCRMRGPASSPRGEVEEHFEAKRRAPAHEKEMFEEEKRNQDAKADAGEQADGNNNCMSGTPSKSQQDDPLSTSRVRKHLMARNLLLKPLPPPGKILPEKDPLTGQSVAELIRMYNEGMERSWMLVLLMMTPITILSVGIAWLLW
mmetsp:Transcript_70512/g.147630  ORF Transcript_70512/g.147630 Transcript_70512/m.147630 type:complete len:1121 (+) Transcript_70512:238-3600(+)|eukprot:CAMPEP_0206493344 /NCGR_PEP_ID=MMETSP0324_2-20121206/46897_1 /ASSEMBLY_ACC=CAM_ASM_000836 /TAXON_ID=2866 /ORGANISM="Crypthecodinium cohnii, Strain Seligo" /LENGTH=1120 /DNA_ID=CAMNT_0053976431 /DNA_START=163 /DNA_END=3525 /DNA_ORIENTATION=+